MTFSEAMFYENYLTSDFHTNTVISRRVCVYGNTHQDGFQNRDKVYMLLMATKRSGYTGHNIFKTKIFCFIINVLVQCAPDKNSLMLIVMSVSHKPPPV